MNGYTNGALAFVNSHRAQLETSGVPQIFWHTLCNKLSEGIFDAGEAFSLLQVENEDETVAWKIVACKEVQSDNDQNIFLVDHAWTFRPESARQQLENVPGLVYRMAALFNLEENASIDAVMDAKWHLAQTYSVASADTIEERMPVWYILDEFGSRIQHSDQPNFRLVPFFSMLDGCAYSLLWPLKDCEVDEEVTRDVLEGPESQDPDVRKAMYNIWEDQDMTNMDWHQEEEPDDDFFTANRQNESLPQNQVEVTKKENVLKVYAEYEVIRKNLKHPRFSLVESPEEADVLWLMSHFKQFEELGRTPSKFINQFPFEHVVTIKDLLCVVCRRMKKDGEADESTLETSPLWLPTTFNLKTELVKFTSYFQHRQKLGLDNHWIVKPWNLARGLDTQVTKSLHHILRLPFSGPKIAQKYLEDPVLFDRPEVGRVKFDIRYILLLQSVQPLKVFAYNRFWLRFANKPFDLSDYDVYEKHFTVMNYKEEADLQQMFCHKFIGDFEGQYPNFRWKDVEASIFGMFKEVFEGATKQEPPRGIAANPQSRAMYAVDLMLEWNKDHKNVQPKLLEINWGPDCKRACDYYPEYFDDVFSTLFLDQPRNVTEL